MSMSIKDNPLHARIRQCPTATAASWIIGVLGIAKVDATTRAKAFKSVGRNIITGRDERKKSGFGSDTNDSRVSGCLWQASHARCPAQRRAVGKDFT